jgi:hypothetical protein
MKDFMAHAYTHGTYESTKFDFCFVKFISQHNNWTTDAFSHYLDSSKQGQGTYKILKQEYQTHLEQHTAHINRERNRWVIVGYHRTAS